MTAAIIVVPAQRSRSLLEHAVGEAVRPFDKTPDGPQPFVQYQQRPIDFMVEILGERRETLVWSLNPGYESHDWDGTVDPLATAAQALVDNYDVSLSSGTGLGKSRFCGSLLLWFVGSFFDARVFTYAPKEDQLRAYMWAEIHRLWPAFQAHFPTATKVDLRIRMRGGIDDTWGAIGMAVGVRAGEEIAVKAQGAHAEHMLQIYEETPGINPAIIEAGEQTATAPHNRRIAVGNPDNQTDALYLFGHDISGVPKPEVQSIRLSALDYPNVVCDNPDIVPGATGKKSVEKRRRLGENDPRWLSRVRGIAPAQAVDSLIRLEWVQAAIRMWQDPDARRILEAMGGNALGVDVANSLNGDEAAIAGFKGACCRRVVAFQCPNANVLGANVVRIAEEFNIPDDRIGVDSVGVGAGAVNEAQRLGRYVRALNGGERPWGMGGEEKYADLRAEILWTLREDLRQFHIAIPPDPELIQELIQPKWTRRGGEIVVESKDQIKKRLPSGRSPNKADALGYGNFVRQREPVTSRIADPARRGRTLWEEVQRELQNSITPEEQPDYGHVLRQ